MDPTNGCVVVKPARGGSSIGVHVVRGVERAARCAAELFDSGLDTRVVMERYAAGGGGKEFTIIVLGTRDGPVPLIPTEVEISAARDEKKKKKKKNEDEEDDDDVKREGASGDGGGDESMEEKEAGEEDGESREQHVCYFDYVFYFTMCYFDYVFYVTSSRAILTRCILRNGFFFMAGWVYIGFPSLGCFSAFHPAEVMCSRLAWNWSAKLIFAPLQPGATFT